MQIVLYAPLKVFSNLQLTKSRGCKLCMNGKDILNKFGFDVMEDPISIYRFSPVYRVRNGY